MPTPNTPTTPPPPPPPNPRPFEGAWRRITALVERVTSLVSGPLTRSQQTAVRLADQYADRQRVSDRLTQMRLRMHESLRQKATQILATEQALASAIYPAQLRNMAVLSQQAENLQKKAQLRGVAEALKSGELRPQIREAVELERQAKRVEKALAWERLRAEKGTVGAYLTVMGQKLMQVGKVAATAFAAGTAAVGVMGRAVSNLTLGALGKLAGVFDALRSAFGRTIELANPAAWIRYRYAIDDLSAAVGRLLLPAFEKLTLAIRRTADALVSLPPRLKELAGTLATFGLLVGGTAAGLLKVLGPAITTVSSLFSSLTVAVTGASTVMAGLFLTLGPAALAVAVPLAALVGVLGLAAAGFVALGAAAAAAGALVAADRTGLLDAMEKFEPLAQFVRSARAALEELKGPLSRIGDVLVWMGSTAAEVFGRLLEILPRVAKRLAEVMQGERFQKLWAQVLDLIEQSGRAAEAFVDTFIDLALEWLPEVVRAVKGMFVVVEQLMPVVRGVSDALRTMFNVWVAGTNMVIDAMNLMIRAINSALDGLKEMVDSLPEWMRPDVIPDSRIRELPRLNRLDPMPPGGGPAAGQFDKFLKWLKGTSGTSVGAAVRPSQYVGIAELSEKARLSAFSAGYDEKAEARRERQQEKLDRAEMIRLLRLIAGQNMPERGSGAASAAAMRGWQ